MQHRDSLLRLALRDTSIASSFFPMVVFFNKKKTLLKISASGPTMFHAMSIDYKPAAKVNVDTWAYSTMTNRINRY
jgi:hypothetical protein